MTTMLDALLITDSHTPDHNSFTEMVDALRSCGAEICDTEPDKGVVEVCVDAREIEEIKRMEGITYIRPVIQYQARITEERNDEV